MQPMTTFTLLLGLLVAMPASGETTATAPTNTPPPTLTKRLSEQLYPLRLQDGRLVGEGAELLVREALAARYVLIGEDHGLAEVPAVTEALFRQLHPTFATYVTEVGSWSAERLTELARAPRPEQAFAELYERHPFSIQFAFYRPEAALLATVTALSPRAEAPIWGIDQEFFLGPQLCFEHLATKAEGETRARLAAWAEAERSALQAVAEQGSPNVPSFMNQPLPEDWPALRRRSTRSSVRRGRRM